MTSLNTSDNIVLQVNVAFSSSEDISSTNYSENILFVCLFDLILYVHSTIFQLCGTVLPGFNQY